jgi:hypothetical protein
MLLPIIFVCILTGAILARLRLASSASEAKLGSMSERWLTEYRASR